MDRAYCERFSADEITDIPDIPITRQVSGVDYSVSPPVHELTAEDIRDMSLVEYAAIRGQLLAPMAAGRLRDSPIEAWRRARDRFIKSGTSKDLEEMLSYVELEVEGYDHDAPVAHRLFGP